MSQFIFIIPEGWIQLELEPLQVAYPSGEFHPTQIEHLINTGLYPHYEDILKAENLIPLDKTLVEVKIFNDEIFIVRLE